MKLFLPPFAVSTGGRSFKIFHWRLLDVWTNKRQVKRGLHILFRFTLLNRNSDQWPSEYQQLNIWFFWIPYLVSGILMELDNNGNYATKEWLSHNLAIRIPRLFQFSHGYCSDLNRPFDDVNSRLVCILDPLYCFKLGDLNQILFCFGEI